MQSVGRRSWWLGMGILLCACHSAFAGSATLTLTSAGNNIMGNVYVNPYTATVNGVSTTIICDDYADDTYLNETWKANTYTFADLGTTTPNPDLRWQSSAGGTATQLQAYSAAAALTLQLLSATNNTIKGELSYAIWGIFDSQAITDLQKFNSGYATAAQGYLNAALGATYTAGQFSNFTIYTPDGSTPSCSGGGCPSAPPQEMFSVAVPEPPLWALLVVDLAALFGLVVFLRRRLARSC